jgi:uncharacterized protein YhfF
MDLPAHIKPFWFEYLSETDLDPETPVYDIFHFDDNKSDANDLANLVLQGKKRATASLLCEYETGGQRPPQAGDLSIVTDWNDRPLCIIETTEVEVLAFQDVDEDFAADEGEGDLSLEYWKNTHWTYFGRVCRELERERSLEMRVVCERFQMVFPLPDR